MAGAPFLVVVSQYRVVGEGIYVALVALGGNTT